MHQSVKRNGARYQDRTVRESASLALRNPRGNEDKVSELVHTGERFCQDARLYHVRMSGCRPGCTTSGTCSSIRGTYPTKTEVKDQMRRTKLIKIKGIRS